VEKFFIYIASCFPFHIPVIDLAFQQLHGVDNLSSIFSGLNLKEEIELEYLNDFHFEQVMIPLNGEKKREKIVMPMQSTSRLLLVWLGRLGRSCFYR